MSAWRFPSAVFFALLVPRAALACPVCFGDPGSPMSRGVEMGIWFLLGVIFLVQAGFGVFFFVYLRKRLRPLHDPMPRPALRLVKNT